jgi:hypothetical protein
MPEDPKFTPMPDAVKEFAKSIDDRSEADFFPSGYASHDNALGGRLEEVADVALGLHRPGFNDNQIADDEIQVFCLKNRNGPRVNYVLRWDGETASCKEAAKPIWRDRVA